MFRNIRVKTPFKLDSETRSTTFTYFDTTGRPTILLEKNNIIDEHSDSIQVLILKFCLFRLLIRIKHLDFGKNHL